MLDGVEVIRAVRCKSHGADASGPWWCVTFKLSEQRVNQLFSRRKCCWDVQGIRKGIWQLVGEACV